MRMVAERASRGGFPRTLDPQDLVLADVRVGRA